MHIHHVAVSPGIQWVEIPDADLRIQCGCPGDSVKHLARRGLITPRVVRGVACESGPNVVILSDLALQNGEFANLAEFPVLHMLYKQGMAIPRHPNNTGRKPILVGAADQMAAQERYIYRGNYGLVSREEILATGASPAQADQMMRLKLAFAFGQVQRTQDLLDSRILGEIPVSLAPGVTIRRIRTNVFSITAGDDAVVVDLNLPPGTPYECPYSLGFRRFAADDYFAVIHTGEGDGWDIHRPCMSSMLTFQGRLYLVDAGPNLTHTLAALGVGIEQVDGVFHTHCHDDHFAGLATLMEAGRRIPYFATPPVRASVAKKLAALVGIEEDSFGDFFDVRDLKAHAWNDVEGLGVLPIPMAHPVETNGFLFRALWGEGYRTYAHLADLASFKVLRSMIREEADVPGLSLQEFERIQDACLRPADVKKVDVGGGMIHGDASDFRDDPTPRLLLAHRAGDLCPEEKEIGSSAAFGTVDLLVEGNLDALRRHAFTYLEAHLPGVPVQDLRMLINHPLTEVNPGTILLKEGAIPREVQLLVTGRVERIRTRDSLFSNLSAGTLIGEAALLDATPSAFTYRASSFVRVMKLPMRLYAEVVRRNGLMEASRCALVLRAFLDDTRLFGEALPIPVLRRIVSRATEQRYDAGVPVPTPGRVLCLVRSGRVEASVGGRVVEVLGPRDFFGEEFAMFGIPGLARFQAVDPTVVLHVPGETIETVPALRWRLLEAWHQRVARILYSDQGESFAWREEYAIQVAEIDNHHRRLFNIARALVEHRTDPVAFRSGVGALAEFTAFHFAAEEVLMDQYGYPGRDLHRRQHQDLTTQVYSYMQRLDAGIVPIATEIEHCLQTWLTRHLLEEDRRLGAFLNARGVY